MKKSIIAFLLAILSAFIFCACNSNCTCSNNCTCDNKEDNPMNDDTTQDDQTVDKPDKDGTQNDVVDDKPTDDKTDEDELNDVTIESLEGEWVGYYEAEFVDTRSRKYLASIIDGTIKIEYLDLHVPMPEAVLWWYGTFDEIKDGVVVSNGLLTTDIEEKNRYVGSQTVFNCSAEMIVTLERQGIEYNSVTNDYINFTKAN